MITYSRIGISITRNTRSSNGMTIHLHSFGDNAGMTKFYKWNGIKFQPNFSKRPLL
jgi:hypothetical protein